MPHRMTQKLKTLAGAAVLTAAMIPALPASPDSLKRGDLPMIDGVTLIGVEDGKLKYRTPAGDRTAPLDEITDLKLENVPAFATGLTAFKEGQMRAAQRAFEGIWSDNRTPWIRHYAGYYLAQVYDARDEPVSAGQVYARLASEDSDLFFLSKPPTQSLDEADADQKERITEEIMAVAQQAEGDRRDILEAYLRMVAGEEAALPQDTNPRPGDSANQMKKDSAVILPDSIWRLIKRDRELAGKWDAIKLLSEGKYQETIDTITPLLNAPGDLPDKLFILGRAQLALADAEQDDQAKRGGLYKDAGLSFMRIAVHFNRDGRPHTLVAASQLEVAYIHKQIGREDIYQNMLFGGDSGGGVHLVIDDKDAYPQYRLRYYQIIGEDPPKEEE